MQIEANRALHGAIWAYAAVHLCAAALVPLAAHEAHYALYARYLDLSYLDHPPLAPWLQSLVIVVWSSDFSLRLLPVGLSVGTQYLLARLTRVVYPEASAWLAVISVLLLQGTLVFHGSMTLSPDAPLLPLALGVVLVTLRLRGDGFRRWQDWLILGLLIGLAGLSKYTAVTVALSVLLIGLLDRNWRFMVNPGLWLAGGVALVLISPVLWWNWQHDWATVRFHSDYQFEDVSRWSLAGFLISIAGQLVYYSPLVIIGGLGVIAARLRQLGRSVFANGQGALLLFVLPVLGLYLLTALESRASPHWSMLGWLLLLPVLARWLLERWASSRPLRALTWFSGTCSVAVYLAVLILVLPLGTWPDFRHPARLVSGWQAASDRGVELLETLPDRGFSSEPILLARNWHHAGLIDWYTPGVRVMNLFHDLNPINFRTGLSDHRTWGVLIYPRDSFEPRMTDLTRDFDCEPREALPAYHGNSLVQVYHLYACYSRLPGSPISGKPKQAAAP